MSAIEMIEDTDLKSGATVRHTEEGLRSSLSNDERVLARFGKRQQLRRGFRTLSAVGLTCGLTLTWITISMTLQYGLQNGGPAGLFYGYLVAWTGAALQAVVMAEMASMIPLAGGPFNWVSVLSPAWCRKFLSYLAGWLSVIAWQSFVAETCFICGTLLQGLLILNYPWYVPQRWHGTLLFWAVLGVGLLINTWLGRQLPRIEGLMLFLYIMGFFGVLIPLIYLSPHKSAHDVFTVFQNLGGWSTTSLSFFVGFVTVSGSLVGVDGCDHIAEEIQNAPKIIPVSMLSSIAFNGSLGFSMLLALLFCMGDIVDQTQSKTGYPVIDIYTYAVGSVGGGTALTVVVLAVNIFSSGSVVATASRMLWAFSRENGLPFSDYLSKVHRGTRLPLFAIFATAILNVLVSFINIASTAAFQAFVGVTIASWFTSFLLASSVMLYKRLTTNESELPWGPFRLKKWGIPITIVAQAYTIIGLFWSFWPYSPDVTAESMNYSSLMFGGAMLFSLLFWVLWGRKVYVGPILEIDGRTVGEI
ncbi:MAG: hypothetical protein Q9195_004486 [Heterodermia aff. obscurata]